MRWVLLVCVVVAACGGPGAEMRPRGRRNSVRINELDERISKLEGQPQTVRSGSLTAELAAVERELAETKKQVAALRAQIQALETAPKPEPPPAP